MDKNCDVFTQWKLIIDKKGIRYWYKEQYGWIPKYYAEWMEARNKIMHTLWFYSCEVLEQAKLIYTEREQISGCL